MKIKTLRKILTLKNFMSNHQKWFVFGILIFLLAGMSFKQILDKTVKKRRMPIEFIVVHYTANNHKGADAEANAKYLRNKRIAGCHYAVDDTEIIQCTKEENVAYAVGGKYYRGFKPKPWLGYKIKNNNSLNFEMCLGGGRNDSIIIEKTAAMFAWQLYDKKLFMTDSNLNIIPDLSRVARHYDARGKHCPRFYYNDKEWNQEKEDHAFWLFKLKILKYFNHILEMNKPKLEDSFQLNRNYEVSDISN